MKTNHRSFLLALSLFATPAFASDDGVNFAYGGDVYLSLQNWPKVGMPDDSKFGFGLGGSFGIGIQVDEMRVLAGPHLSYNRWSADYSNKANSVTDSVYVEMADTGLQLTTSFDDVFFTIGKGNSTISSGYVVNGTTYKYAVDGKSYPYSEVSIGMHWDMWTFSISSISYDGQSAANRNGFRFGIGF